MADALTEYRGLLNKMLGSTDVVEIGALEQEAAHRLGLLMAGGSDTAGAFTLSTALTVSAAVKTRRALTATKSVSDTLLATESGMIIPVQGDTAGLVLTLPATTAGLEYTIFIKSQGDTAADITLKPAATDAIYWSGVATADKDGVMSDASDTGAGVGGEHITVVGDGTDGWFVTSIGGIFKNNTNP